jgi:SAM-dependent methyltransferase
MVLDPPSTFVSEWVARLAQSLPPPRRALDLAMGRGRHAMVLATSGFHTFGVDYHFEALRDAAHLADAAGVHLNVWCADLTNYPLPRASFDVVIVTRYLQRDLFPAIRDAVRPGGAVLYETFTEAQRTHGRGPTSPDHLLRGGELRSRFDGFGVDFYEEITAPDAVARIVARRPADRVKG